MPVRFEQSLNTEWRKQERDRAREREGESGRGARQADTCVSWPCSIPERSSSRSRSHLRHDKEALSHDSWQADAVQRKGKVPKGEGAGAGAGGARRGGLKKPAESSQNDATVSATNGGK